MAILTYFLLSSSDSFQANSIALFKETALWRIEQPTKEALLTSQSLRAFFPPGSQEVHSSLLELISIKQTSHDPKVFRGMTPWVSGHLPTGSI